LGCSVPLTKVLGVPEHLQPPPSYAYEHLLLPQPTNKALYYVALGSCSFLTMSIAHIWLLTLAISAQVSYSLVPRPPLPAFVACSKKSGGKPGRIYHVMRATADVTYCS